MPLSEIYNTDCLAAMREMPDNAFDLAIVDPPYGIKYSELVGSKKSKHGWKERGSMEWDNNVPDGEYFIELFRVSKNQIIWGGNYFDLPPTRCFLIWDKVQRIDQADCEFTWTSFLHSARVFNYARGNESGFAPKSIFSDKSFSNIHPTQKPIALYKWLLQNYAKTGDRILDTHLGSGSSRIAAYDMGFDFVGYELDAEYFEASDRRFKNHISNLQLFQPAEMYQNEQKNCLKRENPVSLQCLNKGR